MNDHKITAILCLLALALLAWPGPAQAQEDVDWTPPYRLSSAQGVFGDAALVADPFGYLHAFWTESGFPDGRAIVQHARFDGVAWSDAADIHVTRPGLAANSVTAAVDEGGILHLAWAEGSSGPVFYTSVPAHEAQSAQNWGRPVRIDLPAWRVELQVDAQDVLHLVYADFFGDDPGVYYLQSADQGQTWSERRWLDPDIPSDYAPQVLRFALDEAGGLHVLWHYVALGVEGVPGRWVRYVHSLNGGASWSLPLTIDEADESEGELRLPYPGLAVQGQTVHAIWAGDDTTHREQRLSTDRGQTWSAPARIFGDLHGQAQGDGLAVDAAGRLHFVGHIRWPKGLYYAVWSGGRWTEPLLFYVTGENASEPGDNRINSHRIQLAVRAGNQLVVTFFDSSTERPRALYTMHRTLNDVQPLAAIATPTLAPQALAPATPTLPAAEPEPTPTPASLAGADATPPGQAPSPGSVLWLGVAPTLLLLGGLIIFRALRRR